MADGSSITSHAISDFQNTLSTIHTEITAVATNNPIPATLAFGQGPDESSIFASAKLIADAYAGITLDYISQSTTGVPHLLTRLNTLYTVAGTAASLYSQGSVDEAQAAALFQQELNGGQSSTTA